MAKKAASAGKHALSDKDKKTINALVKMANGVIDFAEKSE